MAGSRVEDRRAGTHLVPKTIGRVAMLKRC
jgi:hypothetical protein